MREIDRPHPFGIDPRPDDMRMPPPVLFVKDDGAGLTFEAELALDLIGSLLEILDVTDSHRQAGSDWPKTGSSCSACQPRWHRVPETHRADHR